MTSPEDFSRLQSVMSQTVKAHWKAFLFEGILLVVLGVAALILPPLASLAIAIFLGWMFLVSGIGGLIVTYWARSTPGFWWSLISAALAVLAGLLLLARPMQAVLTLTIVLGAYFLAEGVATIMYALEHRREPSSRWSWLLISGLVDIAISFMVITGLPRLGGMGHRHPRRYQPAVRRRQPDRHGAGGAQQQHLTRLVAARADWG